MQVKDIMSQRVAIVGVDDPIEKAAQLMKENDVGSIPVCDRERIVGIVTDRDITLRSVADGQNTKDIRVRDIMTPNPTVGSPQMNVTDAARIMSENQIRRLPIVENNNLVGIIALGDISLEPSMANKAEDALSNISQPN